MSISVDDLIQKAGSATTNPFLRRRHVVDESAEYWTEGSLQFGVSCERGNVRLIAPNARGSMVIHALSSDTAKHLGHLLLDAGQAIDVVRGEQE